MREAFEKAILDNPDEVTTYAAYADWLQEQDDPRGEFMRVQLALENESLPKGEREKLKVRETELLKEHEREWLGELAPFLLQGAETSSGSPEGTHSWRRGLISAIDAHEMTMGFAQALAASFDARLLRELRIQRSESLHASSPTPRVPTPAGALEHEAYFELIGSPCLENLRVFRTGSDDDEPPEDGWCDSHFQQRGMDHVIASMVKIEELHLLGNEYNLGRAFSLPNLTQLRVLRAYHVGERRHWVIPEGEYVYPLDALAANPTFGNLTHLQFHPHWAEEGDGGAGDVSFIPLEQVRALVNSPHLKKLTHLQLRLSDMGDDGVREIVSSGILKQLKWLDLRHGCVTDEGANLFAKCPDTRNLDRLDLSRNAVSAAGLKTLRKAKINAVANRPLTEQELESREYLREGDFE